MSIHIANVPRAFVGTYSITVHNFNKFQCLLFCVDKVWSVVKKVTTTAGDSKFLKLWIQIDVCNWVF